MEKVDQFDRIWVLQAELGLFSSGAPSSEHAVGAPSDSCAMTSNQPHLELMEKSRSNAKLIKKQQIFVYLMTGKKKKKPYPKFLQSKSLEDEPVVSKGMFQTILQ